MLKMKNTEIGVNGKLCFQKILVLALWHERFQAEHMCVNGVYQMLWKGKYKGEHARVEVESTCKERCFSFSGAFKTYPNLWEGRNQEIPIQ
jgi:hypothetical protein